MKSVLVPMVAAVLAVGVSQSVSSADKAVPEYDYFGFGSAAATPRKSQPHFADQAHNNDGLSFKDTRCWWLDLGFVGKQ